MDEGAGEAYPLDVEGVGTVDIMSKIDSVDDVLFWRLRQKRRGVEDRQGSINGQGATTSKLSRTSPKAGVRGNT